MLVSVIIPAWNLWRLTSACLESLARNSPPGSLEVVVVDNGSSDETATCLASFGKSLFGGNFQALRLEENLGFARACNLGARKARGDLLFFLNNDTIAISGWLEPLLSVFTADGKTGACGPLLFYPDGTLQHCGIFFNPFFNVGHLYEGFPGDHPLLRKKRPLQAITGAALMLPKGLFLRQGGFCEDFHNGFEDMDLCFRLTAAGHKLAVAPRSAFYHHASKTPGRFDHDAANGSLLKKRCGSGITPDLHLLARMDGYVMRIGKDLSTWLEVSPERALELKESLGQPDSENLRAALLREPLWVDGWSMLIKALNSEGQPLEAFRQSRQALNFFPSQKVLLELIKIARQKSVAPELAATLPSLSRELELMLARPDAEELAKMRVIVQLALRDAWQNRDSLLAGQMESWLLENQDASV